MNINDKRRIINTYVDKLGPKNLDELLQHLEGLLLEGGESLMTSEVTCPWCGGFYVVKNGTKPNGRQRYLCRNETCKRTFVTSTNTVMHHSHIDHAKWKRFLMDTLEGKSLDYSAERLGFSHQTAFNMRHKILAALEKLLAEKPTTLCEIAELDETYVLDNYKGANGKKYKSDYRAILNWVVKRAKEENQTIVKPKKQYCDYNQRNYTNKDFSDIYANNIAK